MKIYTKAGDTGETRMRDGIKIDKSSCQSEAIGDLDELNSNIGMCISICNNITIKDDLLVSETKYLTVIQELLYRIGGIISDQKNKNSPTIIFDINKELTKEMEYRIDNLSSKLPPLRNFISPTGPILSSQLHISRAVCRRTERHLKALINQTDNIYIQNNCCSFMNRLSDYLFTLARYVNMVDGIPEVIMKGK